MRLKQTDDYYAVKIVKKGEVVKHDQVSSMPYRHHPCSLVLLSEGTTEFIPLLSISFVMSDGAS